LAVAYWHATGNAQNGQLHEFWRELWFRLRGLLQFVV
jgi:hypothetical protein